MGVIFGQENCVNFAPLFQALENAAPPITFKVFLKELGTLAE